jgi:hypothetical protein
MVGNDLDEPQVTYGQEYVDTLRERVLNAHQGEVFGKKARIVAVTVPYPFIVHTDRGPMQGHAGDWLVANHPADDPRSDIWTISDERMQATYILIDQQTGRPGLHSFTTTELVREVIERLRPGGVPRSRNEAIMATKAEDVLARLIAGSLLD